MQQIQKHKLGKVILWCILLLPIVDILNGLFINAININITPGLIIRPLFLMLLTWIIVKNSFSKLSLLLLFLLTICIAIVFQIINGYFKTPDLVYQFKIIYNYIVLLGVLCLLNNKSINSESLLKTMLVSSFIIAGSILLTAFTGTSFSSYENSGMKGFFESHNAVSAIIVMMLPLCIIMIFTQENKKKLFYLVLYSILTLTLLLLGTKSGLFASIVTPFIVLFLLFIRSIIKSMKFILIGFSIIFIAFLTLRERVSGVVKEIISRQIYFFKERDLISYLLSQRNTGVQVIFDNFFGGNRFTLTDFLFGLGLFHGKENIVLHGGETIEMDYFEILHYYGFFVFLFFIILFLFAMICGVLLLVRKNTLENFLIFLSFIYGLSIAALGGHVLTDAFSGLYLSSLGAILIYLYKKGSLVNSVEQKVIVGEEEK